MKYANQIGWSDVEPFEVIRVVSDKTLEIRLMNAKRDTSVQLDFAPGGFTAHCSNQAEQKWILTSAPDGAVVRIRLSKNKGWRDAHGGRYVIADAPRKFYDYNF